MSDSSDNQQDPETLLDRLPSGERTPLNLQVAIVATLLEAAHSSGTLQAEELVKLSAGVFSHLGLSDSETGHLVEMSEILRQDPTKRKQLLHDVGSNFSLPQRQQLLSIVWRILIIDGKVEANEAQVAVEIRKALNLSMEAAVAARIRAEENEMQLLLQSSAKARSSEDRDPEEEF